MFPESAVLTPVSRQQTFARQMGERNYATAITVAGIRNALRTFETKFAFISLCQSF